MTLLATACGGAASESLHTAFASIQVDEARIEHGRAALAAAAGDDERAVARDEICDAAAHLSATARPLDDRDARERGERANEACEAARQRVPAQ